MPLCSPFKPITTIALVGIVLGWVFLCIAIGVSYFITEDDFHMGAFQACQDTDCYAIDHECKVSASDIPLPDCTTFNVFRALLLLGILLGGISIAMGLFIVCTGRMTIRVWRIVVSILGISGAASAAISVFIFAGWRNDQGSPTPDYGASFFLEIIGCVLLGIGIGLLFFGLGREGTPTTVTTAQGAGYAQFNDTSYIQQQQQQGYATYAQ